MMRARAGRRIGLGVLTVGTLLVGANGTAQTPPANMTTARAVPDSVRITAITYLSGPSVYVGAGRLDGVREGATLDVLRGGAVIATLRAAFLSSHSASCEVVSGTTPLAVGDSVRYRAVIDVAAAGPADTSTSPVSRPAPVRKTPPAVRGRVGLRYFLLTQHDSNGARVAEPSADIRLDATRFAGSAFGFSIDARSRRTIATRGDARTETTGRTLVYQASLFADHRASGTRIAIGRQYSAALSPVSLFDGITGEVNRARWGAGLFTGMQPDPASMGYSSDIREFGGYMQIHNRPDGHMPWSFTTGAISSHQLGELNREFMFVQAVASGRVATLYATQELDYNRGWKRAAGEPTLSATSTFASLQIRLADALAIQTGMDNRRNVRLYRDFVSPETEFDDSFRQGVWGGATLSLFHRLRLGGDARASRGGVAGGATSYTGTFSLDRLTALRIGTRLRSTRFLTDHTDGWLHTGSVSVEPFSRVRAEFNGGVRSEHTPVVASILTPAVTPVDNLQVRWLGLDVDLSLGRSWYVVVSGTREHGRPDATTQMFGSLVYRF